MLIKMVVKDAHRQFTEEYASPSDVSNMSEEQQDEEAAAIAEEVIQNFNDSLRPFETKRTLVSSQILNLTTQPICHRWEKTSVVVAQDHIGIHETYICNLCGNTGKEYQMNGPIVMDGQEDAENDDETDAEKIERLEADNKMMSDFIDGIAN